MSRSIDEMADEVIKEIQRQAKQQSRVTYERSIFIERQAVKNAFDAFQMAISSSKK